jgi:hypothetical protein
MAVPVGTTQTFAAVGIHDDVSDTITNIAPYEVPFYSLIPKGKCDTSKPKYQRDTLRAANGDNKVIEGDDVVGDTQAQPEKLESVTQLMDEVIIVSDTMDSSGTYGRGKESKYQMVKASKALKRDIEARITGADASVVGDASTAAETAGAEAWIETNVDGGTSYADGGWNNTTKVTDAPTDGTQRAVAEGQLKSVIRLAWEEGGEPTKIMCGGFVKQGISGFDGIASQTLNYNPGTGQGVILAAADVYVSDFGRHMVIPNRHMRARTALVLTPKTWQFAAQIPFNRKKLGRTGHAKKEMLQVQFALLCKEEKANGKIADLTTS